MAETPAPAVPTPPPLPPPLPAPAAKRRRARIIIGAVVGAGITIATACGIDVCARLASFGWTPSVCATGK